MKISIDNLHYGYKFDHDYSKGESWGGEGADDFAVVFEHLQSYKAMLTCFINNPNTPYIKKLPMMAKVDDINKFQKKYADLIEFFWGASIDNL